MTTADNPGILGEPTTGVIEATVYHNPQCSKSRAALAYLEQRGITPTIIHYLTDTPTAEELTAVLATAGLKAHDIIRTGEAAYTHLGLSAETPDDDLITAMVTHPELIERPLVVTPKGAILARPTDLIATIL